MSTEVIDEPATESALGTDPPQDSPDESTETRDEGFMDGSASLTADEQASALNQAVADTAPAPGISESDLIFLRRRPQVQAALANVKRSKAELAAAEIVFKNAKSSKDGKEAALEAAWNVLEAAECEDAPSSAPLFDSVSQDASAPSPDPDPVTETDYLISQSEWDRKWETFLDQSIDALDITDAIKDKLREHTIGNLRELAAVHKANPIKGYQAIKGIGDGKAEKLADAYATLTTAFMAANPAPLKPESAPEAVEDAKLVDFVSVFPYPVNPTPNETYDESYHREVMETAASELASIGKFKEQLASGKNDAGKELTPAARKKLEAKLGETQMQYDEGYSIYGDKFGKSSAEQLQKLVESKIEKQANLKGGLD